jgi:hypothetical protein
MKVIIYGNNGEVMHKVKQIFESLVSMISFIITDDGSIGSIMDFEDADFDAVIFVGLCPEKELKNAVALGMKAFVLLAPVEVIDNDDVYISQVRTLTDVEGLKKEFEGFFNSFVMGSQDKRLVAG